MRWSKSDVDFNIFEVYSEESTNHTAFDRTCLNARIVRKLRPGEYWLTVRHKKPGATGQYTIGVK